ncbi:MAG: hypothetical protein HY674_18820 [Chloroflexi bacterium]|nr:hypothetical protein [Chloroflexota bacterium]
MAGTQPTTIDDHPLVFVSSFYKGADHQGRHRSPLWCLRRELAALHDDKASTNLIDWLDLSTNTPSNGLFRFVDPAR